MHGQSSHAVSMMLLSVAAAAAAASQSFTPLDPNGPSYLLLSDQPTVQAMPMVRLFNSTGAAFASVCGGDLDEPGPSQSVDFPDMVFLQIPSASWPPSKPLTTGVCLDGIPIRSAVPYVTPGSTQTGMFTTLPTQVLPSWFAVSPPVGNTTLYLSGPFGQHWSATAHIGYYVVSPSTAAAVPGSACPVSQGALLEYGPYSASVGMFVMPEDAAAQVGVCFKWDINDADLVSISGTRGEAVLAFAGAALPAGAFFSVQPRGDATHLAANQPFTLSVFSESDLADAQVRLTSNGAVCSGVVALSSSGDCEISSFVSGEVAVEVSTGSKPFTAAAPVDDVSAVGVGAGFSVPFTGYYTVSAFPMRFMPVTYKTQNTGDPCLATDCVKYLSPSSDCRDMLTCYTSLDYTSEVNCSVSRQEDGVPFNFIIKGGGDGPAYMCMRASATSAPMALSPNAAPAGETVIYVAPQLNMSYAVSHEDYVANLDTVSNYPQPAAFNLSLDVAQYANDTDSPVTAGWVRVFVTGNETGCLQGADEASEGGEVRGLSPAGTVLFNTSSLTDSMRFCISIDNGTSFVWLAQGDASSSSHPIHPDDNGGSSAASMLVVIIAAGAAALLLCAAGVWCVIRRRRGNSHVPININESTSLVR
eukprot:TRINITY_DN308_c5_g1_i1.p1 TRINITY_DN308_c5_g1~~TRINITY_DN308_c5_g1_i1.p1  ORF type:complete len:682 (+),score=219.26 TRINITY_DN308_c5_g1_i1:120-2048(+)